MNQSVAGRPLRAALFVHYFFPDHIYGTEAYTLLVAKQLQALGHEPVVVTATGWGEPPQSRFVEQDSWDGVPVWRIDKNLHPVREILDTYDQPVMRAVHERLLRALNPDLVHVTHLMNHTAALLEVTAAMNIPTFATLTDFFGFCANNRLEAANGDLCSGPNAQRSNCIACYIKDSARSPAASFKLRTANHPLFRRQVSEGLARTARPGERRFGLRAWDLKQRPGLLRDRYRAYRAMVAPTRFLQDAYAANGFEAPLVLSHFGIDIDRAPKPPRAKPEEVRLAFIGQLAPHKGPHLLIEALKRVGSPRLSLDLWGSESQDPAYAAKLRGLAAGLPVRFRGTFPSSETAALMAETDALVIPSTWYENSPLILLQALATHTPVIVSDVLGLTEFIEPERSGLAFPRGDVGALAAVLQRFAADPALATRMSDVTAYARTPAAMVDDLVATWRTHAPELPAMTFSDQPPEVQLAPEIDVSPAASDDDDTFEVEVEAIAPRAGGRLLRSLAGRFDDARAGVQDRIAGLAGEDADTRARLSLKPIRDQVTVVDGSDRADLEQAGDIFLRLQPAAGPTRPNRPLLFNDPALTEEWYAPWHAACAGETPDIGVYGLDDALYHPRGMAMADVRTVLTAPELMPQYWINAVEEGRVVAVDRPGDTLEVDEPVLACITPGFLSFGHILLEVLPRLWLARTALGEAFSSCRIPLHERFPDWALRLLVTLAGVHPDQCLRTEDNGRMIRARRLIVPGMLHADFHMHPFAATFFDRLEASARTDLPQVFGIRRPRQLAEAGASNRRITENIDEIEALLERRGVPLISPEALSFDDQVQLFRRASLIVGEYGSAMHGSIFSSSKTGMLCLGFDSDVQSKIAAFRGQRIGFLRPALDEQRDDVRHTAFDLDLLDRALDLAREEVAREQGQAEADSVSN